MDSLMLDRAKIERFLEAVCERLDGEWVLVGGGAAALWFKRARVTEDIDLIGLAGTAEERYRLMEFASGEGVGAGRASAGRRLGAWGASCSSPGGACDLGAGQIVAGC